MATIKKTNITISQDVEKRVPWTALVGM
jgi:hypothetical protein